MGCGLFQSMGLCYCFILIFNTLCISKLGALKFANNNNYPSLYGIYNKYVESKVKSKSIYIISFKVAL